MLIKAKATVEVEIEVPDALVERDMDLKDPDTLVELMDCNRTSDKIVDAFYESNDLKFELEDVPERCEEAKYSQMEEDLRAWKREKAAEIAWLNRRYA